jgi:hypothetical protein
MWPTGEQVQIQTGTYVSFGGLNGTGMGYSPSTFGSFLSGTFLPPMLMRHSATNSNT